MNEINKVMFQLLNESLFPDKFTESKLKGEYDWQAVYAEMNYQNVSSMAGIWLKKHPISDSLLYDKWCNRCVAYQGRWAQVMIAQNELLGLLEKNNIKCVIIKGVAAGMYYPQPFLRSMGDVDFLVKRTDYENAANILENNGYSIAEDKVNTRHHYCYKKDGVIFELHRRLAIVSESNERLLSLFEKGIDDRENKTIGRFTIPALPAELNGLVILFHIEQHLRTGIGLKQIIDWMMFLYENDGIQSLLPVLKECGLERFANSVTVMCQRYLGLKTFVQDTGNYPCEELMEYILEKGDFGRKSSINGRITSSFLLVKNPKDLFKRLQKGGQHRWKYVGKLKLFKSMAWIYQVGYILKLLWTYKVSPLKLIKLKKQSLQHRNLMTSLGLNANRMVNYNHNSNPD